MRILIAPDSFKGTFSAAEVARAIADGVRAAGARAKQMPVADGGEGTEEILGAALGASRIHAQTVGPWREPISASYSLDGSTAYLNLAAASGLNVPSSTLRDPVTADTYGTGLLMVDAVARGARTLVVAVGGSATSDGGTGACTAIAEHGGLRGARLIVLSDVTTPFEQAAMIFGPQKGASEQQVHQLTARLHQQAASFPKDPRGVAATGAAGGFSGAMWAQFDAELRSGADYVLDTLGFDEAVKGADAVVVGEGRLDSQTLHGKIISAVLQRSGTLPVFAIVGSTTSDAPIDAFAETIVATDQASMYAGGIRIATELLAR